MEKKVRGVTKAERNCAFYSACVLAGLLIFSVSVKVIIFSRVCVVSDYRKQK